MSEEQEVKEPEGEPKSPPPSTGLIDKANAAAERLERATALLAKENERREALAVERALGGEAATNGPPREESASEYAKKALRGELNESKEER